jgi:hypothetical protein
MEEVRIFIETPAGVKGNRLDVSITSTHLKLGIKGNPPFLDNDFGGVVVADECTWTLDGSELEVTLQKMKKAETWGSAFKGHSSLNALEAEEVKKKLTLERFQQEHPGFDFSGAEFSGTAPDPREFLGGVKYGQ